ncbi:MAG: DUF2059 domain-containing protein [Bacteroidaceae bacterium]
MKKGLIMMCLSMVSFTTLEAQTSSDKKFEEAYYTMLEKSGSLSMLKSLPHEFSEQLKQMDPNANPEKTKEISDSLTFHIRELILKKMIPIYQKKLSLDDVRAINTFYDSEAGKKLQQITSNSFQEIAPLVQDFQKSLVQMMNKIKTKWEQKTK